MNIGVSTACLYPMETEKSLALLCSKGIDTFEIFFNTISEITPEYIKTLKNILCSHNGKVISLHPFTSGYEPYLIFTNYERRFKDSLEFYKRYFECGASLGAKFLVIHGDRKTPEIGGIEDREYFDKFGELALTAKKFGMTLVQENVNLFRSQKPEFIRNMKEYLGELGKFVLDIKQAVRSGNDPYEMCDAMGENMVHLHINDNNMERDCLLPGKGSFDYQKLFKQMQNNHYHGDAIIEVYRTSFDTINDLTSSYDYLKKLLNVQR